MLHSGGTADFILVLELEHQFNTSVLALYGYPIILAVSFPPPHILRLVSDIGRDVVFMPLFGHFLKDSFQSFSSD